MYKCASLCCCAYRRSNPPRFLRIIHAFLAIPLHFSRNTPNGAVRRERRSPVRVRLCECARSVDDDESAHRSPSRVCRRGGGDCRRMRAEEDRVRAVTRRSSVSGDDRRSAAKRSTDFGHEPTTRGCVRRGTRSVLEILVQRGTLQTATSTCAA